MASFMDAIKGWPSDKPIDVTTRFSTAARSVAKSGMIARMNNDGEYDVGIGNLAVMPMLLWSQPTDYDVDNSTKRHGTLTAVDPSIARNVYTPIVPGTGAATALVLNAGLELVSTEFVDNDYPTNAPLTAPTTGVNAGKLTLGTRGTNCIAGLVSRGEIDWDGERVLAFWSFVQLPNP